MGFARVQNLGVHQIPPASRQIFMHTMMRMRTMVIKMIVIMNMLRLIRKMLMVLVIFVYDFTPGRPKIAHWLPREGPKISHDKVKLDSDPLIGKSMLLAAATATIACGTHSHHETSISILMEIPIGF